MDGKIYPDDRSGCKCGEQKFSKEINFGGFKVPMCKCGEFPKKFRILSFYPDHSKRSGRSRTAPIRHTDTGERISSPDLAVYMLKQIEKEIENGSFIPSKYSSQSNRQQFQIAGIIDPYLKYCETRVGDPDEPLAPSTFRAKKSVAKNHIIPIFGNLDIQFVSAGMIKQLFKKVTSRRRFVHDELVAIFKFARNELELKFDMPAMPKKPRANFVDADEIPDVTIFPRVVEKMTDPVSKAAAQLVGLYLLRPSDVLTLKAGDIDIRNRRLMIRSHSSEGVDIKGRKSDSIKKNAICHTVPLGKEFFEIISEIGIPEDPNEYIFRAKQSDSFLPYNTLKNYWTRARKEAGFAEVELYKAAKHAGVTMLIARGYSVEMIMRLTGVSRAAIEHYIRLNTKDIDAMVHDLHEARNARS